MKSILKKLALLAIPVVLWFAFFAAFEPNNYFGLRKNSYSTAPIARLRAFEQSPGSRIILGDSRLAHFDETLVQSVSGQEWQNLAFGGASLKETNDLLEYVLDHDSVLQEVIFGLSFYTLSASYNTDRMAALEDTLHNPFAYCLNLEYNVNAITSFSDFIAGRGDSEETGDWKYPADYTDSDGTVYPVHTILAVYPDAILGRCENYSVNESELQRLYTLAVRCSVSGIRLNVVLPPMAELVREQVCNPYGITAIMQQEILPSLQQASRSNGFVLLDYEWSGSCITDDDHQFYDGFHLDTRYGLPQWTEQLFGDIAANREAG